MKKKYVIKRFILSIFTILISIGLTFVLVRVMRGNPFNSKYENIKDSEIDILMERYNLKDPIIIQFKDFIKNALKGDLGYSLEKPSVKVTDIIKQGFPISASIGFYAIIIIIVIGITMGIIASLVRNKFIKTIYSIITIVGISIPTIVSAPLFFYIFVDKFNILPSIGISSWKSFIGPAITLAALPTAITARLTYTSVNEVMKRNFIKTYIANGLPETKLITRHIIPNAALPVLSFLGPAIASLLTGSFVIEKVFTIPGMGKYFVQSISSRDYTVVVGVTALYCSLLVVINFVLDIIGLIIDPRVAKKEVKNNDRR